ncbi:hypothetical protein BD410DRAFT_783216 [Rickenella mellea]|uniref:Crinkler effector protein N-terminal domain-containing protein n=1 Tax=Rickenella mellea TaxID=50990 RepID=A0A4Y7QIY0_9AGAM|nr:hypothetical protein BD410DRAFT_783216 [Rickenella mellea]
MSETLQLWCWVTHDGPNPSRVFGVEIGREASIAALKRAIKNKKPNGLAHIDADALRLWKVSQAIPVDRSFKEKIEVLKLTDQQSILHEKALSELFLESPVEKHLHIIVQTSPAAEDVAPPPRDPSPSSIYQSQLEATRILREQYVKDFEAFWSDVTE